MKRCSRCNVMKDMVDFGVGQKQPDGRQPYCRSCQAAYQRAYRTARRKTPLECDKECCVGPNRIIPREAPEGAVAITLGHGRVTIVDAEDYERYGHMAWHLGANAYAVHTLPNKKVCYLHRVITAAPDGTHVDHINHDKLDNRRSNLRAITVSQNLQNRTSIPSNSTTGYLGVTWDKTRQKYIAQVHQGGKHIFLGRYDSIEEADRVARHERQKIFTHAAPWMLPEKE